ncbi:MAG: extracellular solute-binding protein, partial [Ilumatobacter sp.]|nr:extracellular solute-binding protein [Ilumatobacter sp.]
MIPFAPRVARRPTALVFIVALSAVACSGGNSALDAGNNGTAVTTSPAESSGNDTDVTDGAESTGADAVDAPESTVGPATTIAPIAELPPCPVDALDAADGPVKITFWHGMANELETALIDVVDGYNASQGRVQVILQNQTAYESAIDKYIASGIDSRPDIIQLPEYIVQSFAQSETFVPMQACIDAAGFDMTPILPRVANTYLFEGIQWSMPFNVSSPVLFYNKQMYEAAGLDPDDPPVSLDDLRTVSQQLVDSGVAAHGIVLDSGRDSGGGWFFEQWFGRVGELYADNGNGRVAPATEVLFDNETGFDILTYLQEMVDSG